MECSRFIGVSPEKSWEVSKVGRCSVYKCLWGQRLIGFIVFSFGSSKSGDEYNLVSYLVQLSLLYHAPVTSQYLRPTTFLKECPKAIKNFQRASSQYNPMGRERLLANIKQKSHQNAFSAILSRIAHCNHLKKKVLQDILLFLENLLFLPPATLAENNPNSLNLSSEGLFNQFLLLSSGHSLSLLDFLQS